MRPRLLVWAGLFAAALCGAAPAAGQAPAALATAERVLGTERIPQAFGGGRQFDVSPDGRTVVYVTTRPRRDGGAYQVRLWAKAGGGAAPRLIADLPDAPAPSVQVGPRFSPDGATIAYRGEGGAITLTPADGAGAPRVLRTERAVASFAWSPDGRALGVVLAPPAAPEPIVGLETSETWPFGSEGPGASLAVLDARSGDVRVVTGEELDVAALAWAPDGARLAVAASPTTRADRFFGQDIYLVDLASGRATPIVQLEGVDSEPVWSPDGRRIAFATQAGEGSKDWLQVLGLYEVATRQVSFPGREVFREGPGTPRDMVWASGERLLFTALHRLGSPIFDLRLPDGRLENLGPPREAFASGLAVARGAGELVWAAEGLSDPGDLHRTSLAAFKATRITGLNPGLELPEADLRIVQWRSSDGRWPLEGVLMRPKGRAGRLPVIVLLEGGPTMVRLEFGLGLQYPVHAFVESGYAVFVPNTRGRSGQGEAFRRAIRDDRDYVAAGLGDILSGLDHLAASGEIEPRRVGVAGFSYGAMLTAYAVTHSGRFQAASLNDAHFDLRGFALKYAGNPEFRRFWNDNLGFSDPYDPDAARRMQAQSPLQAVAQARTPTLMEAGVSAMGGMEDGVLALFQGFRRFGAPAEFVRYPRTGHGVQEPRLRFDSARRNLEWFDHWLGLRASSRLAKRFGSPEGAPR